MFCRTCNIELNSDNWYISNQKCQNYICKLCTKQQINKDEKREYDKNYREKNKDKLIKQSIEYYNENKNDINERRRKLYQENKEKREIIKNKNRLYAKESLPKLKLQIIKHYSNSDMKCSCCGEREIKFLQIDHIDCGNIYYGKNKRPHKYTGRKLYKWLIKNNFPDGYQVLCANCNFAKGIFGECPHKEVKI